MSPIRENQISISVFFTCHNEQENVGLIIVKATAALENLDADFVVIVIDDGSRNNTGKIAYEFTREDNRIKVVHHRTNFGCGAALQSGFKAATKELVFYTDGDGQFDINEMPPLLELMKQYDIVSCYRMNRRDNFVRKVNT